MNPYETERTFAIELAKGASKLLTDFYGKAEAEEKSHANLVTEADFAAEDWITRRIRNAFPDHRILAEERQAETDVEADALWVIDPLDGTNNYAHGIPHFSVSIAYAEAGIPKVGVVLDPLRNELFTAIERHGAFLNDRPIHVSSRDTLQQCIIASGFYYDRCQLMERTVDSVRNLFRNHIRGFRRIGAATLDAAWVACGRLDGYFEYQLAPWDYAAAALIVQEAGGRCSDRNGDPLKLNSGNLIAANPHIFDPLLNIVRWPTDSKVQ